jgi:hypothetical protein
MVAAHLRKDEYKGIEKWQDIQEQSVDYAAVAARS